MKVAIIGAGAVGAALTEGWACTGHEVILGVRDQNATKAMELAQRFDAQITSVAEAAVGADVIVLAVPWDAIEDALAALGDLQGKPLVDATNPLEFADGALNLVQPDGKSGAERVAALSQNASVVKTMNQVGAEMMSARKSMAARPSMFIAGDNADANETVAQLVDDLGFQSLQAGGLHQARHLEHFAMVWINQAIFQGLGRDWAFGVLQNGAVSA